MKEPDALAQQAAIYGEPLGDIVHRIMRTLRLTQGRVAQVVGLSAPMLSQLVSGQRVKIGNPAVLQRFQSLSALADNVAGLSMDQVESALAGISSEQATVSGWRLETDRGQLGLRALADPAELRRLADLTTSLALAKALRAAAQGDHG